MDVDVCDCYSPCAIDDHIAFVGWLLEVECGVVCWLEVGVASVCWIAAVCVLSWVLWVFVGLLFGVRGGGGSCSCVGMGVFGWV